MTCLCVYSVTYACLVCLLHSFMCILYVHASASMHLILGTLGTARGRGAHDVETDDGVWWTYPKGGRTGQVLGREMFT